MKSSLKTALYALCCTLLFHTAGNGCKAASLPRYNALSIDMSQFKVIEHGEETDLMSAIMGKTSETVTLWQAVRSLEIAERDPNVKFLFLKTDGATIGTGDIQEFRKALNNFRKSGKPVISYMETPTTGSYYLASVADKVCITSHHGANDIRGVRTRLIFLKDLLDKYGVNVQLIRHGKYKSAGEMFTRNEASREDLEQNSEMVKSMWNGYASEIAESRSITVEALDSLIDNLSLNFSEDFVKNSLADTVVSLEGMKRQICDMAGAKRFSDVKMADFQNYAKVKTRKRSHRRNKIAVIYANGNIVDGNGTKKVSGDRFASMIADIRADSTVKAVVFRINSPGGSVLASEKIKEQIDLTQKDKPVIASYGDFAASGGYLISNGCDRIFSNAATITGSIGVFGMTYDVGKTAKNVLHVGFRTVGSNSHCDLGGIMLRPYDEKETEYMQTSVDDIYDSFVSTVASGRNLSESFVDSIAQGRVWTGNDALKLGLIDQIGTLEDAIRYAAANAGKYADPDLADWRIAEYPVIKKTFLDKLRPLMSKGSVSSKASIVNANLTGPGTIMPENSLIKIAADISKMNPDISETYYARLPYLMFFDF